VKPDNVWVTILTDNAYLFYRVLKDLLHLLCVHIAFDKEFLNGVLPVFKDALHRIYDSKGALTNLLRVSEELMELSILTERRAHCEANVRVQIFEKVGSDYFVVDDR